MESTVNETNTSDGSNDAKKSTDSTINTANQNAHSSSSVIVPDQHHLLDFIFFLCTVLDTVIVQPILFITSDDNVISLPFYIS